MLQCKCAFVKHKIFEFLSEVMHQFRMYAGRLFDTQH